MLKKIITSVFIVFIVLSFPLSAKEVYRSVDEQGHVIFTDAPQGPSEKVEIKETNTVSSPPKPQRRQTGDGENSNVKGEQNDITYELLAIVQPADGDVFQRNAQEFIEVFIVSEPNFISEDDILKVWVNGELQENPSQQFFMETPLRGSYTVDAAIFDEDDNELIRAQSVTFTILQSSILSPNHPKNKKGP